MITVIDPGPMTTIQDEGRWGYQAFGMPVAGAMDRYAYRVANLLVGNRTNAAVLEMTLRGAVLRFESESVVAITGADMQATLNCTPVANWSSFRVHPGDELRMGFATSGCRACLAIQGGIDVPPLLGSRSTYVRAGIGRALQPGDTLPAGADFDPSIRPQKLEPKFIPDYNAPIQLRAILGPQDDHFTPAGIETFFTSTFTVAPDADRMGYRFEGPKIEHAGSPEIISDALCTGSIQIPGHGQPIVLMADHQTTGGYPKIATVIGPDISLLAQARPADAVRFIRATEQEALEALRAERDRYDEISKSLRQFLFRMDITINGVKYDAEVREA